MNCVTHTPMKFLAWVMGNDCSPKAQLWAEDFRVGTANNKERADVLRVIKLTDKEQDMSLDALKACYPYPDQEPGAC